MARSYRDICPALARRIRLIMTDVDGTLSLDGEYFDPSVAEAVSRLKRSGIVVGLVSGRTLPRLRRAASLVSANGPLIAENGGVACLTPEGPLLELGYSRQPALDALARLKAVFPSLREREDNKNRLVDVTVHVEGVANDDLRRVAPEVQISDSGYMVHIMAHGISKGQTLMRLLEAMGADLTPDEVMVFGDSATDASLFCKFPNSVLVYNPGLNEEQRIGLADLAKYESEEPAGRGFVQVANRILLLRGKTGV